MRTALTFLASAPALISAGCPYLANKQQQDAITSDAIQYERLKFDRVSEDKARRLQDENAEYYEALDALDFAALEADIVELMHTSQDEWPSDWQYGSPYPTEGGTGHYGPFFIRMAWHCAGSYRRSDGRGGCSGGRLRFIPERSWMDNTNLDKALNLLWPIKEKYGVGLSWGDLITFTGTIAIKDMGGPYLGFCAGRVDDTSGEDSLFLGPTQEQERLYPCEVDGDCQEPLGPTTVGLIYVNPEGHMGVAEPSNLVEDIRNVFTRMGMNDTETVALIGGGHSFGKCHAACEKGPGPDPMEQPEDPWPGLCGDGKGLNTSTSEFEGSWTTRPTEWTNIYFENLFRWNWVEEQSPRGHTQWVATTPTDPTDEGTPPQTIMLTADLALLEDPTYRDLSEHFMNDMGDLTAHFQHAWYKLMSGDVGPVTRCHGPDVPPPQAFQWPLPDPLPEDQLPDFNSVSASIKDVMYTENTAVLPMDEGGYGPLFVRLAWQCANPYRSSDHKGGCNGARIRNLPQSGWSANAALDSAMDLLQPVKDHYGDSLSWADLIVLSGNVALQEANPDKISLTFTGGRTDAPADEQPDLISDQLEVFINGGDQDDTIDEMLNMQALWGFTLTEVVALIGGGHSLGRVHNDRSGFVSGQWTTNPNTLDTQFFYNLLNLDWTLINGETDKMQYTGTAADGTALHMLRTDLNLRFAMEYRAVVEQFLANEDLFYTEFASAWTKVMMQDRFDVTTTSDDNTPTSDSSDEDDDMSNTSVALIFGFVGVAVGVLVASLAGYFIMKPGEDQTGLKAPLSESGDLRSSSYVPPTRPSDIGETL